MAFRDVRPAREKGRRHDQDDRADEHGVQNERDESIAEARCDRADGGDGSSGATGDVKPSPKKYAHVEQSLSCVKPLAPSLIVMLPTLSWGLNNSARKTAFVSSK